MVDFEARRSALGAFIRSQREMANLSLRQMAALADISNPYLSQIERGLHEPSVHVLRSIARALNLSAETLLAQAGLLDGSDGRPPGADTVEAIRSDTRLTDQQKQALLAVYRSYCADNDAAAGREAGFGRDAGFGGGPGFRGERGVRRPGARRGPEHR